jgi:hypothetical protein
MEIDMYNTSELDRASVTVRRMAVVLVCVGLFLIFGVAAPYKIYRYFDATQQHAAAALVYEEL